MLKEEVKFGRELIREGGLIRINRVNFRIPPLVKTPCGMTINVFVFSFIFGVFVWWVCICVCVFYFLEKRCIH